MWKNLGHFFAVAAHGVVTAVHRAPAVIEKAGEIAGAAQAAEQKAAPTINAVAGVVLSPSQTAFLKSMEFWFGEGCQAFMAAGNAASSGFDMHVTADAAVQISHALGVLAGQPVPPVPVAAAATAGQ